MTTRWAYRDTADDERPGTESLPTRATRHRKDDVPERDDRFVAVEAKAGRTFSETWCKGLRALRDLPGLSRRIVVYPDGPELRTEDGIEVVPLSRFSEFLTAGALWS
jgi:predicted AAA+ superfamily ATPase